LTFNFQFNSLIYFHSGGENKENFATQTFFLRADGLRSEDLQPQDRQDQRIRERRGKGKAAVRKKKNRFIFKIYLRTFFKGISGNKRDVFN